MALDIVGMYSSTLQNLLCRNPRIMAVVGHEQPRLECVLRAMRASEESCPGLWSSQEALEERGERGSGRQHLIAMASDGLQPTSDVASNSNLIAMASTLEAMASKLIAMASNLLAMDGLHPRRDGLQPTSDALQPNSKRNLIAMASTLEAVALTGMASNLLAMFSQTNQISIRQFKRDT